MLGKTNFWQEQCHHDRNPALQLTEDVAKLKINRYNNKLLMYQCDTGRKCIAQVTLCMIKHNQARPTRSCVKCQVLYLDPTG